MTRLATFGRSRASRRVRGFTLVELMVAITGGIFISIAVFGLARHGARFYQRESRVASATMANVIGYERLRADIARAAYLSSPNIQRDPFLCGTATNGAWPIGIRQLAGLRIVPGGSPANATLADNSLAPDQLILAGSYSSIEQFPIRHVQASGGGYRVYFRHESVAYSRLGPTLTDQNTEFQNLFQAGRVLHIVDDRGGHQYGAIVSADISNSTQPFVQLAAQPAITFRAAAGSQACGIHGFCSECVANVVNVLQYDVRNLDVNPNTPEGKASYAPLYDLTASQKALTFDDDRTELVRVERDIVNGGLIADTEEVIAEYAVDLGFGITVANAVLPTGDPSFAHFQDGDGQLPNWAGDPIGLPANQGPQRIRTVTARLSVRSREADRGANITATTQIAPGLYRVRLDPAAPVEADVWARVRTVQSQIALHNHQGALW